MKIWIINPYGNLPGEGWSPYRSTRLANALIKRGHEVVWWVSDFEHRSKRQRPVGAVALGDRYSAEVLPASPYSRHVSLARIRHERNYARSLCKAVRQRPDRPDIIVHGEPAVCFSDISMQAVRYCQCPMVVDVIDLWPELFEIVLPRVARPFAKQLLAPLYRKRKWFFRQADGFLAVSKSYLGLAQAIAPGTVGAVAYLGVDSKAFHRDGAPGSANPTIAALRKRPGEVWCVYVGTLGRNYDIEGVLQCARRLAGTNVKVVIAGDGDYRAPIEAAACEGLVTYLGVLPYESLIELYSFCDIALACYADGSTVAMPLKAFDYLAAGIPIITSLQGDFNRFVCEHRLGRTYTSGDVDSLCSAIQELAGDAALRLDAARRAKQLGRELDCDLQYGRAVDFLEQIATRSHTRDSPQPL